MAKGDNIRYSGSNQKALGKLLRGLSHRHGLWQVFRDFVAMSALAISNAVDKRDYAAREAEYMQIVARYTQAEAEALAHGLGQVVMALEEEGHQDFLGSLFMTLELGNSWGGQFFTPYEVCLMMAKITLADGVAQKSIAERGFVTVNDPCSGSGAMLIASAQALQESGINYQQEMHVTAQDIDITAVYMTYVQLSLLHIPAVVIHGNSLMVETRSVWRTPAHVMGFWGHKLRRAEEDQQAADVYPRPTVTDNEPTPTPRFVMSDDAANNRREPKSRSVSQYSLF